MKNQNSEFRIQNLMACLLLSAFCLLPYAFGSQSGGSGSSMACAGGEPVYCARTDGAPATAFPAPLFTGTTGANQLKVDPLSGERILRVTDVTTPSSSSDVSFVTDSASESNEWSSDSHRFYFLKTGGSIYFGYLDPATMQVTLLGTDIILPNSSSADGIEWGRLAADSLDLFGGDGQEPSAGHLNLEEYSIPNCSTAGCITSVTATPVLDVATACGITIPAEYSFSDQSVAGDDKHVSWNIGLGGNNAAIVGMWDGTQASGHQCSWYNTLTGMVGGTYGITTPTAVPNFPSMSAPAAPTVTSGTACPTSGQGQICAAHSSSGTLTAGHTYEIETAYDENAVGESAASAETNITLPTGATACGGSTCNAIQVSQPANPANSVYATGPFSVYACDQASCTSGPVLQQDVSMTTPAIGTACTGTGLTVWIQNTSTHFTSVPTASQTAGWSGSCGMSAAGFYIMQIDQTNQSMNFTASSAFSPAATAYSTISIPSGNLQNSWTFGGWNSSDGATLTIGTILTGTPSPYATGEAGYTVHNSKIGLSGSWVKISVQSISNVAPYTGLETVYWQAGTTNVVACTIQVGMASQSFVASTPVCDGHQVNGYGVTVNARQNNVTRDQTGGMDIVLQPFSACPAAPTGCTNANIFTQMTSIVDTTPSPYWSMDWHDSWSNDTPSNTEPILMSTGIPSASPVLRTWADEVLAITPIPLGSPTSARGPVYRFGWNYSSDQTFWSSPRGNVSPNGRWFMFTSDMEVDNTTSNAPGFGLGDSSGNPTCIPWSNPGGNCRQDVFIMELN